MTAFAITHDASNMADSIRALPLQCLHALEATDGIGVPEHYRHAKQILLCGMGGSALGAHVIQRWYEQELQVPFLICRDYNLPGWVGPETLVILSSYSGSTAETLSAAEQAIARKSMLMGITAGGPLGQMLDIESAPWYRVEPTHNPCGQPRMALGYALFGLLGLLCNAELLPDERQDIRREIDVLTTSLGQLDPTSDDPGAMEADSFVGKAIVIVASEHLEGNAHIMANQINENAKAQATWHNLPEVNHHLMEGLLHPPALREQTAFLLLQTGGYTAANRARYEVMKSILLSLRMPLSTWGDLTPPGLPKVADIVWTLAQGSWLSFILSQSYGVDPSPIPYVDKFKQELKSKGF